MPSTLPPSSANSSQREQKSATGDDNASSASSWVGSNTNSNPILREEGDEYFVPIREQDDRINNHHHDAAPRQRRRTTRKRQQQHHDNDDAVNVATTEQQQQQQQQQNQPPLPPPHQTPSFSDRITSSAVSGTLGLLRLASDVTLSTTGKLVAPPLQATQHLLLPALYAAFVDFLSSVTSQRVKDWFRILQASLYHLVTVLQSTPAGQVFRQEVVQVGSDIVECVSSDTSRQVIADAMACLVKFSETLHTPQMKALLDQLGVLSCRCIDAASSGRNKQLWLDVWSTIWSGTAVLADPATTMALAEVTAHLCHALEMEEAVHRKLMVRQQQQQKTSNTTSTGATAAQRRYRRNQYQTAAYVNPDLTLDPDVSVEDVIVSSLGDAAPAVAVPSVGGSKSNATTAPSRREIPQQVTLTTIISQEGDGNDHENVLDHDLPDGSPRRSCGQDAGQLLPAKSPSTKQTLLYNHIPAKVREETVDVAYLRECIQQRYEEGNRPIMDARNDDQQQSRRRKVSPTAVSLPHPPDDPKHQLDSKDSLEDLEELASKKTTANTGGILKQSQTSTLTSLSQRPRMPVVHDVTEDDDDDDYNDSDEEDDSAGYSKEPSATKIKEAPVAQFYRILDEILTQKRQDAIQAMLDQAYDAEDDRQVSSKKADHIDATSERAVGMEGGRVWYPQAAAAAGAGNERGQATIRHQLSQLKRRGESTVGLGYSHQRRSLAMTIPSKYKIVVLAAMATVVMFGTLWFGLGCYGIYKLIYPHGNLIRGSLMGPPMSAALSSSHLPTSSSQEIVVRIIREVVHVNEADSSLDAQGSSDLRRTSKVKQSTELNDQVVQQMVKCVADASSLADITEGEL